jgi:ABC-2 type transport system ATP-binding protein
VTLDFPASGLDVPGARVIRAEGANLTLVPDGDQAMPPRDLVRRAIERLPVIDIAIEEPDLEDVVRAAFAAAPAAVPSGGQ